MWGQSFADLAKKAAELQEQAASSMASTSTNFPSIGGAGGLFNLDNLQEKGDSDGKGATAAAMGNKPTSSTVPASRAAAPTSMLSNTYKKPPATAKSPPRPAQFQSKIPTSSTTPPRASASLKAPSKAGMSLGGTASSSSLKVGNNTAKPAAPIKGTLGGVNKAPVATPKGKLIITTKTSPSNMGKGAPVATLPPTPAVAPADSPIPEASTAAPPPPQTAKPVEKDIPTPTSAPPQEDEPVPPSKDKLESPLSPPSPPKIESAPSNATEETVDAIQQDDLIPIPSPKQSAKAPITIVTADGMPSVSDETASAPLQPVTLPEDDKADTNDNIEEETPKKTNQSPVMDISFSIPHPEEFGDEDFPAETPAKPLQDASMLVAPTEVPQAVKMDHDDDNDDPPTNPQDDSANAVTTFRTAHLHSENSSAVSVANNQAAAELRNQLQQQFTDQLQRLEENNQAEQAARQAEYKQALENLQKQLQEREQQLQQHSLQSNRQQGEVSKQIDSLQRELRKAKELLADKEREDRRLQEAHLKQLRDMEKQLFKGEDTSKDLHNTIRELEDSLKASKEELEKSQEEYKVLKERAKNVATELKERRAECRTLASEMEIFKANNADLLDRVAQLEAAGMDMNQSSQEIQEELSSLRSQLEEEKKEKADAQKAIDEERKKGEEALSAYKKKAQQSLALANSRAASAVQAKEEAELEARAARSTADSAMQRAMAAETNGKQALAEAKQFVEKMETEVAKYNDVKEAFEKAQVELEQSRAQAKQYQESNEKLKCELTSVSGRLEAEQASTEDLKSILSDAQTRSNELYDEVERLRRENQRNQDEIRRLSDGNNAAKPTAEPKVIIRHEPNAEAEATIAMLKQELRDANQAIKDLKETLKATVEERNTPQPQTNGGGGGMNGHNGHSDAGMPLFYAMEKQAELTQARDEIARLANLLGDAESTKQEALEAAEEMRMMMEDAQSRLRRQEQLKRSPEEEQVNLEYLKNIVLSYLNATTSEEKKTLLPVIGTVLCLTAEEQRKALEAVEKSGASVIDSVASSVLNLNWR